MTVRTSTDVAEIAGRLDRVIAADPVLHTVLGTVRADTEGLRETGWCAWDEAGSLAARAAAAWPVTVTDGWTDVAGLAEALGAVTPSPVGLGGPAEVVEELADRLGRPVEGRRGQRLFRLDELTPPRVVPGRARPAGVDDLPLLTQWLAGFAADAHEQVPSADDARAGAERALRTRLPWLWLDADGAPVSLAVAQPPAAGVARIGPVYTPPERRGHGHASAVTAHATARILEAGHVPVLFTDVANPTSNKIYRALGYRPVADRLQLFF
jgi:predicted GNAT family acetyltransferase